MTEEKIQGQKDQAITAGQTAAAPQPARRRLLKSTVAIPVIMTLHSGAAFAARTSNLVGPVEVGDAVKFNTGEREQLVCVNSGNGPLDGGPTYDLGETPTADFAPLFDTDGNPMGLDGQAAACREGGAGILISATAYTSLQGKGFLGNFPPLPPI